MNTYFSKTQPISDSLAVCVICPDQKYSAKYGQTDSAVCDGRWCRQGLECDWSVKNLKPSVEWFFREAPRPILGAGFWGEELAGSGAGAAVADDAGTSGNSSNATGAAASSSTYSAQCSKNRTPKINFLREQQLYISDLVFSLTPPGPHPLPLRHPPTTPHTPSTTSILPSHPPSPSTFPLFQYIKC